MCSSSALIAACGTCSQSTDQATREQATRESRTDGTHHRAVEPPPASLPIRARAPPSFCGGPPLSPCPGGRRCRRAGSSWSASTALPRPRPPPPPHPPHPRTRASPPSSSFSSSSFPWCSPPPPRPSPAPLVCARTPPSTPGPPSPTPARR